MKRRVNFGKRGNVDCHPSQSTLTLPLIVGGILCSEKLGDGSGAGSGWSLKAHVLIIKLGFFIFFFLEINIYIFFCFYCASFGF